MEYHFNIQNISFQFEKNKDSRLLPVKTAVLSHLGYFEINLIFERRVM